jgi:hypothetical protein
VEIRVTNSFRFLSKIRLSLQLFSLNWNFSTGLTNSIENNENPTIGLVSDKETTDEQSVERNTVGFFSHKGLFLCFVKNALNTCRCLISVYIRAEVGGSSGLLHIVSQEITHFAHWSICHYREAFGPLISLTSLVIDTARLRHFNQLQPAATPLR